MGRLGLDRRGELPIDAAEVGFSQSVESGEEARSRPQAFEQQVIETERKIEGRIAKPGALGVDEDWAFGPDQSVLRADIAIVGGAHQPDVRGNAAGQALERAAAPTAMSPEQATKAAITGCGLASAGAFRPTRAFIPGPPVRSCVFECRRKGRQAPAGAAGRTAYSVFAGNRVRRTASGSPGLLPAGVGRGLSEPSSAGTWTFSRRSSSIRARITAKSSAARGRVTFPPFSFLGLALWWEPLYRRRAKLGTGNRRSLLSIAGGFRIP